MFQELQYLNGKGYPNIDLLKDVAKLFNKTIDELLSSDYGFGSAISLFIATNLAESCIWYMFSPITYNHNGTEFEGAILNAFHQLITRTDKLAALYDVCFRAELPNLSNVLATIIVLGAGIWIIDFAISGGIKAVNEAANTTEVSTEATSDSSVVDETEEHNHDHDSEEESEEDTTANN